MSCWSGFASVHPQTAMTRPARIGHHGPSGVERLVDHQRAPQLLVDFAYEAAHGVFAFLKLSAGELEEAS